MTGLATPPAAGGLAPAAGKAAIWAQRPAVIGRLNTEIAYVTHDAWARDLQNLITACLEARIWTPRAARTLRAFTRQLWIYFRAADETLRPALQIAPAATGILEELDAHRAPVTSAVAGVNGAFARRDIASLFDGLRRLTRLLDGYVRYDEDRVLPLIAQHLGPASWDAFDSRVRRLQGMGGAAGYFPWLIDGATASTQRMMLGLLPAPARALHHAVWLPRYRRTHFAVGRSRPSVVTRRRRAGRA